MSPGPESRHDDPFLPREAPGPGRGGRDGHDTARCPGGASVRDGPRAPLGTGHAGWPPPRPSPESHKHHLRSGAQRALEAGLGRGGGAAGPEEGAEQVPREDRRPGLTANPCPATPRPGTGPGRAGRRLGPRKNAAQGPGPVRTTELLKRRQFYFVLRIQVGSTSWPQTRGRGAPPAGRLAGPASRSRYK